MRKVFITLASGNVVAIFAATTTGYWSQSRAAVGNATDLTYIAHFSLGLTAAILTLLVHCIIFTYFLGTGRWVKEVKYAYGLPDEPWPKLTRELKRRTFPVALGAMLIAIAAAAAGAGKQLQAWPSQIHETLACLTFVVNLVAFWVEYRNVRTNGQAIDEVLNAVERIRAERGLPTNAEALSQLET